MRPLLEKRVDKTDMIPKVSRLRRAFIRTFPYSIGLATLLFVAVGFVKYRDASMIADTNRDGIVSQSEWRQIYKKTNLEYPPRTNAFGYEMLPCFALSQNIAITSTYRRGELSDIDK